MNLFHRVQGLAFFVHSSAMYWELSSNQEFTFVPHDL